jgi:hypothetical protein
MKRLILLLVVSSSAAWADPRLELEVAGGASAHCLCKIAPTLSARVGVDFAEHFTPSIRLMTFALPGSDNHTWAVLGEFRAHTKGRFQVNAGVGIGFGAAAFNAGEEGLDAKFFRVDPYVNVDVGARVMMGRWWIGANVGGMPGHGVYTAMLSVGVSPFGG